MDEIPHIGTDRPTPLGSRNVWRFDMTNGPMGGPGYEHVWPVRPMSVRALRRPPQCRPSGTTSNKKLVVTGATLVVTGTLLVVTKLVAHHFSTWSFRRPPRGGENRRGWVKQAAALKRTASGEGLRSVGSAGALRSVTFSRLKVCLQGLPKIGRRRK